LSIVFDIFRLDWAQVVECLSAISRQSRELKDLDDSYRLLYRFVITSAHKHYRRVVAHVGERENLLSLNEIASICKKMTKERHLERKASIFSILFISSMPWNISNYD
jgi:hexokinase